ncbi:hypothetical protein V9K67_13520 [Paraflavisolibacter sp. H34]|uniref:hypothetical protein n=1 Tax=Huijunlia imazamoxiresistens TaxID=3127457 RepID=UPI00301A759C
MKVIKTYLVKADIAHNFLHQEITVLPGRLTELYQCEELKWYIRKVGGIEEISGNLALQIIEGSKAKKQVSLN